jgi:molybdopterin-guanine dinucleotide biosynthesis protein A
MGTDKGLLNYHGKIQCYYVYEILNHYCEHTFISCNASQLTTIDKTYPAIEDNVFFKNTGPIAGLLTAFDKFPGKDLIVIGCDYPFLDNNEVGRFVTSIKANAVASAFYDDAQQYYQPVLAWYSSSATPLLLEQFGQKKYSLQHFLRQVNADRYIPQNRKSMLSVDTEEAKERAIEKLLDRMAKNRKPT